MTHACRCGGRAVSAGQTVGEIIAQAAGAQLTLREAAASAAIPLDTLLAAFDDARKACS